MAISEAQKVDLLWKKIGYGRSKTDTNANKKATNESISSPLLLRGANVWAQSGDIPATQPASSGGVVTVYPTTSPVEATEDITATSNRTWKTGSTDWIPPEIGSTYLVKVYVHTAGDASNAAANGTQVLGAGSGNDDEWFFDYQSGVLHFIGTNLPNGVNFSGKSVYVAGARYTGIKGVSTPGASNTFTDVNATGIVTATIGLVGDQIRIGIAASTEIDTLTDNLILDSAGGTVNIDDNLNVVGVSTFASAVDVNAAVNISGLSELADVNISSAATITGALDVNGGADISGGETTLSSATVSDLTSGRVVLAGTSGALEDTTNLTFDGSVLDITGNITVSGTVDSRDILDDGQAGDNLITLSGVSRDSTDLGTFAGGTISNSRTVKQALQDLETSLESLDLTFTTAEGTNGTGGGGGSVATSQTMTFAGTTDEINVTVSGQSITYGLPNDVTVSNNLTVSGNLYVNGSTTQVNTATTTIEDQLLDLGMVDGSVPSTDLNKDIGVLFNYYIGDETDAPKKAAIYWDDSTSRIVVSADVSENSGVLTNNTGGALEIASLYVNGCTGSTVEVIKCTNSEIFIENSTIDCGAF